MSDEKRPTRLLAFRLRRDGAARARNAGHTSEARVAASCEEEFSDDAELSTLLRAWDAPEPSSHSRGRLLAEFRATARRAPLWRRALSSELRVPLPFAACAALAVLASLFVLAARTQTPAQTAATNNASAEVRVAEAAPTVKIVEVPVERERVVTRFVYVEKSARPYDAQQRATTRQSTTTQRSATTTRGTVAHSNSEREEAARQTSFDPSAQSSGEPTSYFTRVDMADFQPADEMKIRIVKRGKTDEK
jgi:hypothetical protein